jgi:hypothetical protein
LKPSSDTEFGNAWPMLQQELDIWADSGLSASFWWRDDDAVAETPQLNRLDALSREFDVPISIAVIPALLDTSLSTFLLHRHRFSVLQHGFGHTSYAEKGVKKIEIGGERKLDDIRRELAEGYQKLAIAFPSQFVPVLVPPWNRINSNTYETLLEIGLLGISTVRARLVSHPRPNLLQINSHLDPINWRHGRGFIGSRLAIAQLHQHLFLRRTANRCRQEPTGLLTHHLDQNEQVWNFCRNLFTQLNQHPAVQWLTAKQMWL